MMANSDLSHLSPLQQTLHALGAWFAMLPIRLFIAWEFWQAGVSKYNGNNWFEQIYEDFPFPFNAIPTDISWFLATWTELIGAIAILIGFFTRFWAAGLIILDLVAWYSVHAGNGYNVCDNGFKMPLIYLIMLIPLLLSGPGKLSLDCLIQTMRK